MYQAVEWLKTATWPDITLKTVVWLFENWQTPSTPHFPALQKFLEWLFNQPLSLVVFGGGMLLALLAGQLGKD